MTANGIIFNSVTWFVQLPDRTKTRVKRDDLDTMTEAFTGPSAYEDAFVPPVGAQHPLYNLMTVISTDVRRMPAAVSEVTVHYQGKLANSGASGYTSVPTINKSWMEGEVTYQINGAIAVPVPFMAGSGFNLSSYSQTGILSYSRRYTGRCVEIAYITNRIPTGEPTQIGAANGFMGFQNIWDTMTGFSGGMTLTGGGSPIQQMACTDVRVEDRADGWYRVTEMYQSRMFPGKAGYQYAPPTVSAPAGSKNIASDTSNQAAQPDANQNQNVITFGGAAAGNAAGGAASDGGYNLGGSAPGSVGAVTAAQTGMDPNWNTPTDPTTLIDQGNYAVYSAASAGAGSGGQASDNIPDIAAFNQAWLD